MGISCSFLPPRFWQKVQKTSSCWLWTAGTTKGYGMFWLDAGMRQAHRLAYSDAHGPIPDGLCVDHLCRTPRCVNPAHMELVTIEENSRRAGRQKNLCAKCGCRLPRAEAI